MVLGHGPEVSPLMVISDYPTADEFKDGKALNQGASAKMVKDLLRYNNWSLDRCYKTTYIKQQIPGYGGKDKKKAKLALEETLEAQDWGGILKEEINIIQPNVILSLGELPLNFLTGEKKIHNFRGSILPIKPGIVSSEHLRVVPTLHPRDIFAKQSHQVYVNIDYGKAVKNLNNKSRYSEPGNLWICKTVDGLVEWWKRARYTEFITLDIETLYNYITCISFCHDGKEALSIPLLDKSMSKIEQFYLYRKINDILKSKVPKVNQNIKYDWTVLEKFGFELNNIIGDTMLMAHTLYAELPKGLNFLTSIYTDIPYYKDEGKEYDPKLHDFSRMLFYNAKDALATWQVWDKQLKDAEDLKVKHFYFDFVQPLFFHYKKLDDHGILVDEIKRQELEEKYVNLAIANQASVEAIYGRPINFNSPKQIAEFVYDFLACPKHYHTNDSGEYVLSTGEEVLREIYLNEITDDTRKDILKQVILGRKIDKVLQFLQTPYSMLDNRMRTSSKLHGTENGRSSMSEAIGWYYRYHDKKAKRGKIGTSFQTIPKHGFEFEGERYGADIRQIFIPSPGKIFIDADGSNAEGHVVCVLAEDWETLEYMLAGNDLHKLTASWIFVKPIEHIKKDERQLGKKSRHAGNLGQGPGGLSIQINRSRTFCKQVLDRFHAKAPNVQGVYHWNIRNILKSNNRELRNPQGRLRTFMGKIDDHAEKEGFSYLPQSTVGDHYKAASLRIAAQAPWAPQFFEAHDGLAWEIDPERKAEFLPIVWKEMRQPINFSNCTLSRDYDLVIPCETGWCELGGNWQEMKDFKEEEVQNLLKDLKLVA